MTAHQEPESEHVIELIVDDDDLPDLIETESEDDLPDLVGGDGNRMREPRAELTEEDRRSFLRDLQFDGSIQSVIPTFPVVGHTHGAVDAMFRHTRWFEHYRQE